MTRILLAALVLAGCNAPYDKNAEPKSANLTEWHKEKFEDHVYVVKESAYGDSIAHDPDCPCQAGSREEKR